MYKDLRQSSETDQDQMDQNHIQCILNGICNDHVDLDPFLKIANQIEFNSVTRYKNKIWGFLSKILLLKQLL